MQKLLRNSSYFLPSKFVVEFANWFTFEVSLMSAIMCLKKKSKTVAPKIPRVIVCPCCTFCPKTIQRMSPGTAASSVAREDRLYRLAELGKQPDLKAKSEF